MPDRVILIAAVTVDGYIARHNLEITNCLKEYFKFKFVLFKNSSRLELHFIFDSDKSINNSCKKSKPSFFFDF